jgi:hypothetical protein
MNVKQLKLVHSENNKHIFCLYASMRQKFLAYCQLLPIFLGMRKQLQVLHILFWKNLKTYL